MWNATRYKLSTLFTISRKVSGTIRTFSYDTNNWEKLKHFRFVPLGRLLFNIFYVPKLALFTKGKKNIILRDSKRSSFSTDFFEVQFDTPTLIIPSFRMIKATGCKQWFKSDLLRMYLVGFIPESVTLGYSVREGKIRYKKLSALVWRPFSSEAPQNEAT